MKNKLCIGITVSNEPYELVAKAIQRCIYVFGDNLSTIIINDNFQNGKETYPKIDNLLKYPKTCYHSMSFYWPQSEFSINFLNRQALCLYYLEISEDTHFLKIDPDTFIVKWDNSWPELAGQFLHYTLKHQQERFQYMPKEWQEKNREFYLRGSLHGIHGGYCWMSREFVEKISKHFISDRLNYLPEFKDLGKSMENR